MLVLPRRRRGGLLGARRRAPGGSHVPCRLRPLLRASSFCSSRVRAAGPGSWGRPRRPRVPRILLPELGHAAGSDGRVDGDGAREAPGLRGPARGAARLGAARGAPGVARPALQREAPQRALHRGVAPGVHLHRRVAAAGLAGWRGEAREPPGQQPHQLRPLVAVQVRRGRQLPGRVEKRGARTGRAAPTPASARHALALGGKVRVGVQWEKGVPTRSGRTSRTSPSRTTRARSPDRSRTLRCALNRRPAETPAPAPQTLSRMGRPASLRSSRPLIGASLARSVGTTRGTEFPPGVLQNSEDPRGSVPREGSRARLGVSSQ